MLMHASLTGGVLYVFMPLAISGAPLLTWYLVFSAALWLAVAGAARANGWKLSGQPVWSRAA